MRLGSPRETIRASTPSCPFYGPVRAWWICRELRRSNAHRPQRPDRDCPGSFCRTIPLQTLQRSQPWPRLQTRAREILDPIGLDRFLWHHCLLKYLQTLGELISFQTSRRAVRPIVFERRFPGSSESMPFAPCSPSRASVSIGAPGAAGVGVATCSRLAIWRLRRSTSGCVFEYTLLFCASSALSVANCGMVCSGSGVTFLRLKSTIFASTEPSSFSRRCTSRARNFVVSIARLVRLRTSSFKNSVRSSFATFVATSGRLSVKPTVRAIVLRPSVRPLDWSSSMGLMSVFSRIKSSSSVRDNLSRWSANI